METCEVMTHNAQEAARTAAAGLPAPTPELVHFAPGDCALLIGPAETLLKRLEAVRLAGLRPALLCTDAPDLGSLPRGLRALPGELAALSGWMGAFTARMAGPNGAVDLAPLSFHADGHFDWVLDFSGAPRTGVAPLGHYALAADDFPGLKRALVEIAGRLRAGFDKPRYFQLEAGLCAHDRQGIPGCDACLSACPADAITGDKEGVRIEPHLCQGCGTCALVCPSGAVRYAHPARGFSLARLQAALAAWEDAGGGPAGVWIVRPERAAEAPAGWLTYALQEPASLGLETWLAVLAAGAARVAVAADGLPDESRRALAQQIAIGRALLEGLGLAPALGLIDDGDGLASLPALPARQTVKLSGGDDKRALLFAAIDALAAQAGPRPGGREAASPLPGGPMGAVRIHAEQCTLCAACVRICPSGALALAGSMSKLAFTEQRCLQCGLCAHVCPEKAVTLEPRLLYSAQARQTPRVVAEAEMFACTGCGKPFATRAMIERSRAMMASHPMFQGEQAKLMTLCPDCRQRAMAGCPPRP